MEDFLDKVAPMFGSDAAPELRLRFVLLEEKLRETGIQPFTLRKAVALLYTLKKALRDDQSEKAEIAGECK